MGSQRTQQFNVNNTDAETRVKYTSERQNADVETSVFLGKRHSSTACAPRGVENERMTRGLKVDRMRHLSEKRTVRFYGCSLIRVWFLWSRCKCYRNQQRMFSSSFIQLYCLVRLYWLSSECRKYNLNFKTVRIRVECNRQCDDIATNVIAFKRIG